MVYLRGMTWDLLYDFNEKRYYFSAHAIAKNRSGRDTANPRSRDGQAR
jgi:hypothetical protein